MLLVKVIKIDSVAPFGLRVAFSDGTSGIHDCSYVVQETGPMIEPLKDPDFFARVYLDYGAPTWPNGYDMCPDWLRMEMTKAGELAPHKGLA